MLYSDDHDKYFNSLEDAYEYYLECTEVPEVLYECKSVDIDDADLLAQIVIEYIDDNIPSLNADDWFSDFVSVQQKTALARLLQDWITTVGVTVEPDYSKPVKFKND